MHLFASRVENSVHHDQLASKPDDLDLHSLQNSFQHCKGW